MLGSNFGLKTSSYDCRTSRDFPVTSKRHSALIWGRPWPVPSNSPSCNWCSMVWGTPIVYTMAQQPQWPSHCRGFMTTLRHTTVGGTPLDEWSAGSRDLYLTTHNTHKRPTSVPPGGFRNHNHRERVVTDPCLRRRGHWDRRGTYIES